MTRRRRSLRTLVGSIVIAGLLTGVASANITWSTGAASRTLNSPKTCNDSPTCTDSGSTWVDGAPALAASNDGTTHYLYTAWATDQPSGDEDQDPVPDDATCASTQHPVTLVAPYCSGVYFSRSTDGGSTWSAPSAISDPTKHADRFAIAASGPYVYAVYVTTVGFGNAFCTADPRVLYVRKSTDYGATWGSATRLSELDGRVDYPTIAAAGATALVLHTDSDTGQIVLDRSTDNGDSWGTQSIGWTTNTYDNGYSPGAPTCPGAPSPSWREGFSGQVTIAGDGTIAGAAWIQTTGGKAVVKVSGDNGATWPGGSGGASCPAAGGNCTIHLTASGSLGAMDESILGSAAAPGRFAVTWVDNVSAVKGVYVRQWTNPGGFGPPRLLSCFRATGSCATAQAPTLFNDGYAPSVALFGSTGIAVTWAACPFRVIKGITRPKQPCNNKNADEGAELLWKESPSNGGGSSFGDYTTTPCPAEPCAYRKIAGNGAGTCPGACSEVNEWPTALFDTPGAASTGCTQQGNGQPSVGCVRYVLFGGRMKDYEAYRVFLATGTQT